METKVTICRKYTIEAAHHLPNVGERHKCRALHGHRYTLEVEVGGGVDPEFGWVIDFAQVDEVVDPILRKLDHGVLNDVVQNPTAELFALWVLSQIGDRLNVESVTVYETERSSAKVKVSR